MSANSIAHGNSLISGKSNMNRKPSAAITQGMSRIAVRMRFFRDISNNRRNCGVLSEYGKTLKHWHCHTGVRSALS